MTDIDLWTKFEKTGCIADYLSYRGVFTQEKKVSQAEKKEAGERIFESVGDSDGNDIVRSSYR